MTAKTRLVDAVRAVVDPVTGGIVLSVSGVATPLPPQSPLVTVVCGNSIAKQNTFYASDGVTIASPGAADTQWMPNGTVHLASMLSGGSLRFKPITAGTRIDAFGVYGYSGQTLSTINADLAASFFTPLNTSSLIPDLVIGYGLVENDIAADTANATLKINIDTWLSAIKCRWPGVKVMLCTPLPSFSYNTPAKVSEYQYARTYILSLDNGSDVFASDLSPVYENSAAPATPLSGYTDASVHPYAKGALALARVMAATIARIIPSVKFPYPVLAENQAMSGSVDATATRISGTKPTAATHGTPAATASLASTALQPGWQMDYTAAANATLLDLTTATFTYPSVATTATRAGAFAVVEVLSGAENLQGVVLAQRHINDNASNDWHYHIKWASSPDSAPDYQNGDVLTLVIPPQQAITGRTLASVTPYLRTYVKTAGGTVSLKLISMGVGLPT